MAKAQNGTGSPADKFEVSEINLRVLAAASIFASKDESRYYLNGVCLEIEPRATTYISTNGHQILCYREESAEDARENLLTGNFIIPTIRCKSFKLDKEDEGRATLFLRHGRLTIAHNMVDMTFSPIDGVYPNWRRAVPRTAASGVLAQYSFKLLDDFRKFAVALDLPPPFLAPNGGDAPAFIWFAGRDDVFGGVMPHRSIDLSQAKPLPWALRGGPKRDQSDIEDDELMRHPDEKDDDQSELDGIEPETAAAGASEAADARSRH